MGRPAGQHPLQWRDSMMAAIRHAEPLARPEPDRRWEAGAGLVSPWVRLPRSTVVEPTKRRPQMMARSLTRRCFILTAGPMPGALVLAGCGGAGGSTASATPVKLTQPASLLFWSILGGADGTRMHDMTQQYVRETPLVQIDDIQGVPDFIQKFIASSVAGSPPDIVWIRQTYIPGFAEKNMLLDLLPKELQQVGLRAEDFDPTVWKASEYKGKRYTIPMDIHGYQLIWNEAAVREGGVDTTKPPATWQDWQEWASRLTQGDRYGATINSSGGGLLWHF